MGEITGKVVDAETGDGLPFANVYIELKYITIGEQTDFDGFYSIKNVPEGEHNVIVEYIGYKKQEIEVVRVKHVETLSVDVFMKEDSEFLLNTDFFCECSFWCSYQLLPSVDKGNITIYNFDNRGRLR